MSTNELTSKAREPKALKAFSEQIADEIAETEELRAQLMYKIEHEMSAKDLAFLRMVAKQIRKEEPAKR